MLTAGPRAGSTISSARLGSKTSAPSRSSCRTGSRERASLTVTGADGASLDVPCFPLPHAAPVTALEADLVAFDAANLERVRGAIALYDVPLLRIPHPVLASWATWTYDPGRHVRRREPRAAVRPRVPGGDGARDRCRRRRIRRHAQRLSRRLARLLRAVRRQEPAPPRRLDQRQRRRAPARRARRRPRARPPRRSMPFARPSRRTTSSANCRAPMTRR